jgi:predicted Zn-dependent protease with MMP-like domain
MKREPFVNVVEEALDSLPQEFRSRIRNVVVPHEKAAFQRRIVARLRARV